MYNLTNIPDCDCLSDALGISQQRFAELGKAVTCSFFGCGNMGDMLHELATLCNSPEELVMVATMTKDCISQMRELGDMARQRVESGERQNIEDEIKRLLRD
jgi:hypothetical protein